MRGPWASPADPRPIGEMPDDEPTTTIGGITESEYVPICPVCRGLVRRDLSDPASEWTCDTCGPMAPSWEAV